MKIIIAKVIVYVIGFSFYFIFWVWYRVSGVKL